MITNLPTTFFCLLLPLHTAPATHNHLTDEELIDQILHQQNQQHINTLYNRYADKVYRKCLSFVKDDAAAEDLAHDVFIKVLLNLSSFKGRSKFSSWLYSVTYNFCIDHLRKKNRLPIDALEDKAVQVVNAADIENADELNHIKADRLKNLLEQIKTEEKMILLMKYSDDLSLKEIQEILKISESAVKMRLKRAKEKVQALYEKKYSLQ